MLKANLVFVDESTYDSQEVLSWDIENGALRIETPTSTVVFSLRSVKFMEIFK